MTFKRIKTSLGLYDEESYLKCLPGDLHADLLNHLGNDIKCIVHEGTWTHFTIKTEKHVCTFAISTISEFLSWLNDQSPNNLSMYQYGTYSSNTCQYVFTKRPNRLHIFAIGFNIDSADIVFDHIQSLIVNYKLIQLHDEYMKYRQLTRAFRVVF